MMDMLNVIFWLIGIFVVVAICLTILGEFVMVCIEAFKGRHINTEEEPEDDSKND